MEAAVPVKKQIKVLVIGTDHNLQRHQDTDAQLEKVRTEFEKFLCEINEKEEIDLVAEEAGDDKQALDNLKRSDEEAAEFERQLRQMMEQDGVICEGAGLFGGDETVGRPVPTIAKTITDKHGVRREDVDVDIRVVDENDTESIKKRGEAIAEEILKVLGAAEKVLVIVGEKHRADVVQRLKEEGMDVDSMHFPE